MSIYPHASASVHTDGEPTTKRLARPNGEPFVAVTMDASIDTHVWIGEGGPQVSTRLDGEVSLYLSPAQAAALGEELLRVAAAHAEAAA